MRDILEFLGSVLLAFLIVATLVIVVIFSMFNGINYVNHIKSDTFNGTIDILYPSREGSRGTEIDYATIKTEKGMKAYPFLSTGQYLLVHENENCDFTLNPFNQIIDAYNCHKK